MRQGEWSCWHFFRAMGQGDARHQEKIFLVAEVEIPAILMFVCLFFVVIP
jgi:hypothetical protein